LRLSAKWIRLALLVGCAEVLAYFHEDVLPWLRVAGWSLLALALVYLLRRGRVQLFGPVLFYDLIRNARRARTFVTRSAYLSLLFLFLWSAVDRFLDGRGYGDWSLGSRQEAAAALTRLAALAESFFYTFLAVQLALTVILTPAYVAPAIAEEKERKTLEFLLATDLDSREILLGKLLARLGHLVLLLLAGLPVLSAVQFLGGVDPDLVFAGFAATAVTALGLAGLSILVSVHARRSRDAILLSYAIPVLYLVLCLAGTFLAAVDILTPDPLYAGGPSAVDCLEVFQAGNPFFAAYRLFSDPDGTLSIRSVLPAYAGFHLLLAAATLTLAVVQLRPVALREAAGPKKRAAARDDARGEPRPVVGRPMVWKEIHFSGKGKLRWWECVVEVLLAVLSLAPACYIVIAYMVERRYHSRSNLPEIANLYVRVTGTVVACLVAVAATLRGAMAVRIEKDKETLDALLTSPLSTREILFGKWVGCLWAVRWAVAWLGSIYLFGLVTGGLSPLAVPLLVAAVLVYCGTLTTVGLWFSVVSRTTVRAALGAVVAAVVLGGGQWLLWLFCGMPTQLFREDVLFKFLLGMTPAFVLAVPFPASAQDYVRGFDGYHNDAIAFAVLGTVVWATLGTVLWFAVVRRFRNAANRQGTAGPAPKAEGAAAQKPAGGESVNGWGPFADEASRESSPGRPP
jgi:ABC-type transport system involved in multi-copper enzyme maturation permease subunit